MDHQGCLAECTWVVSDGKLFEKVIEKFIRLYKCFGPCGTLECKIVRSQPALGRPQHTAAAPANL